MAQHCWVAGMARLQVYAEHCYLEPAKASCPYRGVFVTGQIAQKHLMGLPGMLGCEHADSFVPCKAQQQEGTSTQRQRLSKDLMAPVEEWALSGFTFPGNENNFPWHLANSKQKLHGEHSADK